MKKSLIPAIILSALMSACAPSQNYRSKVTTIERAQISSVGLEEPWRLKTATVNADVVRGILAARDDFFLESNQMLAFDNATESSDASKIYFFFHETNAKDSNIVYVFDKREKRNIYRFYWSGA